MLTLKELIFRYLKSQLKFTGEIHNDDNHPRTFARFLGNQLAHRERSRSHLWQNRNSTLAQDSLNRVSVVSQSLVESLLQRLSEYRIMPYCTPLGLNEEHSAEDIQTMRFDWFIRASPFSEKATVNNWQHLEVAQSFAPLLRSVTFSYSEIDVIDSPSIPLNAKLRNLKITELPSDDAFLTIISLNGYQVESLELDGGVDFSVCDSLSDTRIAMLPRLKRVKLSPDELFGPHTERVIPWRQLTSFSVKFDFSTLSEIYQCGLLLDLLAQMVQLRHLSISHSSVWGIFNGILDSIDEFYTFIISKTSLIQQFTNLEIFSLCAMFDSNHQNRDDVEQIYPDYRFFLDQFSPKFGSKLRKLILNLPSSLESTHHCLALDFSQGLHQLEILVLNFERFCSNSQFEGFINYQDDGPIQSQTIRQLTIKNLENYYPLFLNQIPDIFPNLVELNIGSNRYRSKVAQFTDQDLMQIIHRLPHLHTLRITNDITKAFSLNGSIDLMCKRAMELKPRQPMQFRIPLDADFMFVYGQLPDAVKAELPWIKAAKWIQVY